MTTLTEHERHLTSVIEAKDVTIEALLKKLIEAERELRFFGERTPGGIVRLPDEPFPTWECTIAFLIGAIVTLIAGAW